MKRGRIHSTVSSWYFPKHWEENTPRQVSAATTMTLLAMLLASVRCLVMDDCSFDFSFVFWVISATRQEDQKKNEMFSAEREAKQRRRRCILFQIGSLWGKGIDVMTKKAEMPIHPESLKLDARAIMAGQVGMIGGRPLSTSTLRGKGRCSIDSSLVFQ